MCWRVWFILISRKIWFLLNSSKFKKLGKNSFIMSPILIKKNCLSIGNNVFIRNNSRIEGIESNNGKTFSPNIIIEDDVTIEQNLHLTCASTIYIGKNTAIAANVTITDIHHQYTDINIPIEKQDFDISSVYIGSDSKIYCNVVILPGTIIGNHVTIGANSVVSGKIPDYSVVAGVPAKVIKQYDFETKVWEKK